MRMRGWWLFPVMVAASGGCTGNWSRGMSSQDADGTRDTVSGTPSCEDKADDSRRTCLFHCDSTLVQACFGDCNARYRATIRACHDLPPDAAAPQETIAPESTKKKAPGVTLPITPEPPFYFRTSAR